MANKVSDEQLMKQLSLGNKKAAGILYERYHRQVFGYFVRMTGNFEAGRDLTQNLFLRIIKYSHNWKDDKTFRYWLFHIARNLAADFYRDSKVFFTNEDDHSVTVFDQDESEKEAEKKEAIELLTEAMEQLPPAYREVIELNRFQGFSYKEIAVATSSTESAVRVKAFRAIKKLKDIYSTIIMN